jgi:F0F1-type ATP synthase assembly protein I
MREDTRAAAAASGSGAPIRIPTLWPLIVILATPVAIGLGVFLKRYRGTDRTAMVLGVLVGAGLCVILGLAWLQRRFGSARMSRQDLRRLGFRCGAIAGACAGGVGVVLLAVRWAIDQLGGPAGEQFLPAFYRAFSALWWTTLPGLPAYLAVGIVVGGVIGLIVAEAIGACAKPSPNPPFHEE